MIPAARGTAGDPMRIADVAPHTFHPPVLGGSVRIHSILKRLARRHEVRAFALARNPGWPPRTRRACISPTYRETQYAHPLSALVLRRARRSWATPSLSIPRLLAALRPPELERLLGWSDVVVVEGPWAVDYCRAARPGVPLVLAAHNVERLRIESHARLAEVDGERVVRRVSELEARALEQVDLVVAVSPEDREAFVRLYGCSPEKIVVVPSGADTRAIVPAAADQRARMRRELGLPDRPTAVFPASNGRGNLPGLAWIRRLAEARGDVTFLVVGPVSPVERRGALVATGEVPDVVPYLRAADIGLCPIEYGAGTKIKLFEMLAAGLPTLAFAESLAGTAFEDGRHLLVAEKSVPSLLAGVERLLADGALARRLGTAGRELVVRRYDWELAAERFEEALATLTGSARPAAPSSGLIAAQFAS